MFDKSKVLLNHARSYNSRNKKSNNFFLIISNMLLERALSKGAIKQNNKILELAARNNFLYDAFKARGLKAEFYQTTLSKYIRPKSKKSIIIDLNYQGFKNNYFDICFCILSINSYQNSLEVFKNIYSMIKPKGIFLAVFPSNNSFSEFKGFFIDFFQPSKNLNFNPSLDIQTLGNIGNSAGFKNIIVDKEKFTLEVKYPEEIWQFIRSLGESNYLTERKNFKITKPLFKKFYNLYEKKLKENRLVHNTFALNFFIGCK